MATTARKTRRNTRKASNKKTTAKATPSLAVVKSEETDSTVTEEQPKTELTEEQPKTELTDEQPKTELTDEEKAARDFAMRKAANKKWAEKQKNTPPAVLLVEKLQHQAKLFSKVSGTVKGWASATASEDSDHPQRGELQSLASLVDAVIKANAELTKELTELPSDFEPPKTAKARKAAIVLDKGSKVTIKDRFLKLYTEDFSKEDLAEMTVQGGKKMVSCKTKDGGFWMGNAAHLKVIG